MKCKQCGNEVTGKGKTCSAKCRKALQRSVTTGDTKCDNVTVAKCDKPGYVTVENAKVYGRQAVKYDIPEAWELRPEPLSPDDQPKPKNRGKYIRPDGTEYLFDACGKAHEAKCEVFDPGEGVPSFGQGDSNDRR